MGRPKHRRRVCCLPENSLFGPLTGDGDQEHVILTVEEYESIRLIDLDRLTQEESAERMQVARTTIQAIYKDARRKIADAVVNGKVLRIKGGVYLLYDEKEKEHGCLHCRRRRMNA